MSAVAQTSKALHKPTQAKSKYRPEIDGLRAFAVVAVIINHFNKDLLPSGYLGVDIFFVISGYVITSSLADRKSKNFLDFVSGFYERRITRLVPALVVFVLITSVLISLFNPVPGVALGMGWRTLLGISNVHFYNTATDYFAQSTELNPFTHTWSLGVEEQFYLLFPFLIWFSGFGQQTVKGARNLFLWVGTLSIASLVSFIYLYQVNQPAAYFLMPPRFWEMAAGCLIFICFQKRAKIEQALMQVPPLLVVLAMVGVMFLPSGAEVPATISIVLLSAMLIACLKKGTMTYDIFTQKKVVYVGLISYSLYLWHWSVLCISRWTIGIHWWSFAIQVGAMLLLATKSYYWVEKPLRKKTFKRRVDLFMLAAICIGIVTSALLAGSKLISGIFYIGKYPYLDLVTGYRDAANSSYSGSNCSLKKASNVFPRNCAIKGTRDKTIYFVGDSHASHYRETHFLVNRELGLSIDGISINGCAFPSAPSDPTACGSAQQKLEKRVIAALKAGDIVAISNRYSINAPINEPGYWMKTPSSVQSLNYFARKVFDKGGKIVLFGPLPEFQLSSEMCTRVWFRPLPHAECEASLEQIQKARATQVSLMKSIDARILIYAPIESICQDGKCTLIDAGNKPLFVDDDHLTDYANRQYIFPSFKKFIYVNRLI